MSRSLFRAIDILLALVMLPAVSVVTAVSVLLVRADSSGSAIFQQERIGERGTTFTLYKLRTMRVNTPNVASHEVAPQQMTRIGSLLRSTKVDELPQVWNVLRGDMGFVGPRPCLPSQTDVLEARREHGVSLLRPGITGPAQIRGIDMSKPDDLARADAEILNADLAQRLSWVLATFLGRGSGDAVPGECAES